MGTMVNAVIAGQMATRALFESLWIQYAGGKNSKPPTEAQKTEAIGEMVMLLASAMDRNTTKSLPLYVAVLWDLTPQELVLAFSRAAEEDKFFPAPSRLRELCGREPVGDPVEREAVAALTVLLSKMRAFGWELKPRLGRVLETTGEDGRLLAEPKRAPSEEPNLPGKSMQALAVLGWGDWRKGAALLREHPAVKAAPTGEEQGQYQVNALKQADEIRKRWVEAYRQNLAHVAERGGRA